MKGMRKIASYLLLVMIASSLVGSFANVSADRASSTDYTLDSSSFGSFGGPGSSTSYQLTDTGGESLVGSGSSSSYVLAQGYQSSLVKAMKLTIQPSGLLAYFPLDEDAGNAAYDASATGSSAYFQGNPTWAGSAQVGGGLGGFTGSSYLKTADMSSYNSSALTACGWANLTSTSSNPAFFARSQGAPTSYMWSLGFDSGSNAQVNLTMPSGTTTLTSTLAGVGTGVWSFNCFSYGGTDLKLYVNGQLAASQAINVGLSSTTQALSIGALSDGSRSFPGTVDELKVFNRVLAPSEISALYSAGSSGLTSGIGLGTVTSGTSNMANFDTIVETDASSYDLAISSSHDLQNGTSTIPGISGTIVSPLAWSEGTTKGLGFTISAASGLDAKWGSGANYAAFPATDTTFFSRTGFSGGGAKDVLHMQARVDVTSAQIAGVYTAQFTVTGTVKP